MREVFLWIGSHAEIDAMAMENDLPHCAKDCPGCHGESVAVRFSGPQFIEIGPLVLVHPETELETENVFRNVIQGVRKHGGRVVYIDEIKAILKDDAPSGADLIRGIATIASRDMN